MSHALGGAPVVAVEVVETFLSSAAEVARLRITPGDGGAPFTAIGKSAAGEGLAEARRERWFFDRIAPRWDAPSPGLLGAWECGHGSGARLLLLIEDLGVLGYGLLREAATDAQVQAVIDTLVTLHARFWGDPARELFEAAAPMGSVTRAAQAWPTCLISANATAVRSAAAGFVDAASSDLAPAERDLLDEVLERWEPAFVARAASGQAITLIHGDFHLLGNILFSADHRLPRVIDWSELKPGLGPHDLAYCLMAVPSHARAARDRALLRRYWEGLVVAGVEGYSWELCQWDHGFSLVTNLFQSVFQQSVTWFRRTAAVISELDGLATVRRAPPVG